MRVVGVRSALDKGVAEGFQAGFVGPKAVCPVVDNGGEPHDKGHRHAQRVALVAPARAAVYHQGTLSVSVLADCRRAHQRTLSVGLFVGCWRAVGGFVGMRWSVTVVAREEVGEMRGGETP